MTRLFRFVSSSLVLIAGLLAAEQKTAKTSNPVAPSGATTAPAPSPEIPLEEVAMQLTQVENLICGFATNLADATLDPQGI